MATEDGAGGRRKAKHTDYYTSPVVRCWSLERTQLFLHMAAPPVGQAAEVRLKTQRSLGGGIERQRGGPSAVCVVGQMFNFTPFFHSPEVITARKERAQNPANILKGAVNRRGDPPVYVYPLSLWYFESKSSQLYLKFLFGFVLLFNQHSKTFVTSPFKSNFGPTGLICTSSAFLLSTHIWVQSSSRCCGS